MTVQPAPLSPELPDVTASQAKVAAITAVRWRFNELLYQASQLCQQADQIAALGGLSDIEIQQARAAGKLAGVNFYSMSPRAEVAEFQRLEEGLRHVARSVDPLILAIGEDAKANSHEISDSDLHDNFKDAIFTAIDGNALFCLEECATAAQLAIDERDFEEQEADHRRKVPAVE